MLQNPDATAKAWADRIAECARKREAYQDRQAAGYMTLDKLGKKLAELDEERATAQRELDKIQDAQGADQGIGNWTAGLAGSLR